MRISVALLIATALLFISATAEAKTPKVAVSLKPLHAIVSAVMKGAGEPDLLIDGKVRNDAASIVDRADLVVWLGVPLEGTLLEVIRGKGQGKALTLMQNDRFYTLELRDGSEIIDPHLWMDPRNMTELARLVGHLLSDKDPDNAALYERNAKSVMMATERLRKKLEFGLYSLRARPFYALYDGYQYLERGFGLRGVSKPEEAVCIVGTPKTSDKELAELAKKHDVKTSRLDLFIAALPAGPKAYEAMIDSTLDALKICLSNAK